MKKEKIKIDISDLQEYSDASAIMIKYLHMNLKDVDFSKIFVKPLTKANIQHLDIVTNSGRMAWPTSLILVADIWAKEFNNELTPEFKSFIKQFEHK